MLENHQPLLEVAYLRSVWAKAYRAFEESPESEALLNRLKNWSAKDWQKETVSEGAFIEVFFKQTWGYHASGVAGQEQGHTLEQQYPVKRAGQQGGTGEADIALGYFGRKDAEPIPQVLGEFKDDRSGLDKPQVGRRNNRSPVDQCLDYLRESRSGLISPILPTWGLVTDMNEFRLYLYGDKTRYQRFVIRPDVGDPAVSLLGDSEEAAFHRFLFYRTFHIEELIATSGRSRLEKLAAEQLIHEQALEKEFYKEYHAYRSAIYQALRKHNPAYEEEKRLGRLVKFTQRILDRCLFILFCEDMGQELNFPPNVLRDALIEVGNSNFYDPDATDAWTLVKRLFVSMRNGTPFGSREINKFNGGLFEEDPAMDHLHLPNHIFCAHNQGQSPERLLKSPQTLLHFAAKYNFGASSDGGGRTLTLTAMGRIFEQSITDLEAMEAHAEGRESLTELTKRKRDGVYYTPEWVTHYIVQETIGARLAEIRKELGFDKFADIDADQIEAYRSDKRKSRAVGEYAAALHAYRERLDALKVVDPACGSGAFLIQAFKYLYDQRQWLANEFARLEAHGTGQLFDTHAAMREILSQNLYGVDINAESVELTRLALWLHTALPDRPLTVLDKNIRCGNSLVGHDFYQQVQIDSSLLGEEQREQINTFEWEEAFPEVFDRANSGFDCVIGNPPYVKLQHFRRVQDDTVQYLLKARRDDGSLRYESTQTGNFDLYLPFIERGVELLNLQGKMGYIAPNVWLVNEYGEGLRKKLKRMRRLERWVDFKSYQVFDEATTYTALQFFTGSQTESISCVEARDGRLDIGTINWHEVNDNVFYCDLSDVKSWAIMPTLERALFTRLTESCYKLGDPRITTKIFQGMVTSLNSVYHLLRSTRGYYQQFPDRKELLGDIEEIYLRPLVTGTDAKRYQTPIITTYLLFPYDVTKGSSTLAPLEKIREVAPLTWEVLKKNEFALRQREYPKMDRDDKWWGYVYPKNQVEQAKPKVMVASTATEIRAFADYSGAYAPDDRRVYSVVPKESADLLYIMGLLNCTLLTFLLRQWARPKANGYYDIETQFLAPLPIPRASMEEKSAVANLAKKLQELHTKRRDLLILIDRRLESEQCEDDPRDEGWLWADVKPIATVKKAAPAGMKGGQLTAWAKSQRESRLLAHLEGIDLMLQQGLTLTVENHHDELRVLACGKPLIQGVFLDEGEAEFIAAQWRHKARRTSITETFDGKRLLGLLLKLRKTENTAIVSQVVQLDAEVTALDSEIDRAEREMNALTYRLYGLTDEEIRLVEGG